MKLLQDVVFRDAEIFDAGRHWAFFDNVFRVKTRDVKPKREMGRYPFFTKHSHRLVAWMQTLPSLDDLWKEHWQMVLQFPFLPLCPMSCHFGIIYTSLF